MAYQGSSDHIQNRRRGISRPALLVGAVLWAAVFVLLGTLWKGRQEGSAVAQDTESTESTEPAAAPVTPGESRASVKLSFPAKPLPDFEFDEVMGGTLSLDDLKGKRWVASFVFSRCTTSCPMISAAVMRLHERVAKNAPEVLFVTFTVDPKYDTVEVFRNYSETFTKGERDRWKFLTGSQQKIYELVVNGFGLYVKENLGASRLPGLEVAHSNRVVLVNEAGIPVGTFLGTREEDMVKLRRILTGREEFPEPGPGLTFSTSDGSPLNIQFEVKPVTPESDDAEPETGAETETGPDSESPAPNVDTDDDAQVPPLSGDGGESLPSPDETDPVSAAEHNRLIDARLPDWARRLPSVNAGLNTLAALLLLAGLFAIRRQNRILHRNLMLTAFGTSAVFLASYLAYHYALGEYTGEHGKKFGGDGLAAAVYPWILWPHVILAVFVPVLAIRVFLHAFAERWDAHKKLARITFPIWMYVSVTGVVIYGMLYHWPWPAAEG
ncbi:MAG: DUF420 domain-containing protein [Fuerstiella sp.]